LFAYQDSVNGDHLRVRWIRHASCPTGSWITLHAIQTDLPDLPCQGYTITTSGIVTAVLSDGFYLESADSTLNDFAESWDSNTCTSEGIFVYTPTGLPSNAVLKNHIEAIEIVHKSSNSDRADTLPSTLHL
jgi:predicted extracellular nuclease